MRDPRRQGRSALLWGLASFAALQALMAFDTNGDALDLMSQTGADGSIQWTAPPGQWTVYAISQRFSGQNVKRAAPGGRGPMLNPFYSKAMSDYLKWFDTAFGTYSGAKPRAVFQDSYEYRTDWSPDFFAQFEKMRGYKLQTELPALFMDTSGITNAATLDLATTANSVMLVLGGQPVRPQVQSVSPSSNDADNDSVRMSRVNIGLPPGAPVVT